MILELKDARGLLYRGPALVVGPGATTYPTVEEDCLTHLFREFPDEARTSKYSHYYDFAEIVAARQSPRSKDVRTLVQRFFESVKPHPQLQRMVNARWTAVISLTADGYFRTALRDYFDSRPIGWTVTQVLNPATIVEPKSVPVYELLGAASSTEENSRLAVLRSEYLSKRRHWAKVLRSFPDFAKGDPIFFAGTSAIVPLVCDCMNELLNLGAVVPRRLIFLSEDPTATSPGLLGLVKGYCQVDVINCSLAEFCEMASPEKLAKPVVVQSPESELTFDATKLYPVEDQVVLVRQIIKPVSTKENKHRLLDVLFSPTNLDWSPYAAGLDFERRVTGEVQKAIAARFEAPDTVKKSCILIKGEAGAGKTVLMRRLAYNCAKGGDMSIWIRPGYGLGGGIRFDAVVRAVEDATKAPNSRVVFFLDDPFGARRSTWEILTALSRAKFPWVLVIGVRNSDLLLEDDRSWYLTKCETFETPNNLDTDEVQRLPSYLVGLDAAKDNAEAGILLSTLARRDSQGTLFGDPYKNLFQDGSDVLCMLWYLLPQTRAAISGSLTNEYLRLGGIAGAVKQYADATFDIQGTARTAYELVTTTSGLGTPLPVEVLVASLGIGYEDWLEMCSEKKPLWGLLYSEPYPEGATYGFRTRNHVVTKVLLSILNGGSPGHAGEFRCLKNLIGSCTSSGVQYREFLCDILVGRKKYLQSKLSYAQGLELYDLAMATFPLPDRTIAHHRALWIKDVGQLPLEAYEALQDVQRVSVYPHADRPEPIEHIHTSMAACALQAVSQGKVELLHGVELVHQHIAQASMPHFFDLYSEHLNARTLIKLAEHVRSENQQQFMACLEEATRIIDRALLIIDPLPAYRLELTGAGRLFSELRAEVVIAFADFDQAKLAAFDFYRTKRSQMGFVLAARLLIGTAREQDKGGLFKKAQDFINEAIAFVEKSGEKPVPDLFLCRAQLMIFWRVLRQKSDISWDGLKSDLKAAVNAPKFSRDPIWLFYLAVSHFHVKEMPMADALFSALRQTTMSGMLRNPFRCLFMGPDGAPKTFQGEMTSGGTTNRYIHCGELGCDIMARKGDFNQPDKATVHFRVAFSLLGPLAVRYTVDDVRSLER